MNIKGALQFSALFLLILTGCGDKNKTSSGGASSQVSSDDSRPFALQMVKIKMGEKLVIDSPEKFIQLYVLYNYEQIKWIDEFNAVSNNKVSPESFLADKKTNFYKSFGLKEDDFNQYSISHINDISTFLEKNADYNRAYIEATRLLNQAKVVK